MDLTLTMREENSCGRQAGRPPEGGLKPRELPKQAVGPRQNRSRFETVATKPGDRSERVRFHRHSWGRRPAVADPSHPKGVGPTSRGGVAGVGAGLAGGAPRSATARANLGKSARFLCNILLINPIYSQTALFLYRSASLSVLSPPRIRPAACLRSRQVRPARSASAPAVLSRLDRLEMGHRLRRP
jgi:hypothetical protein